LRDAHISEAQYGQSVLWFGNPSGGSEWVGGYVVPLGVEAGWELDPTDDDKTVMNGAPRIVGGPPAKEEVAGG
jgi:hypothetical protein